MNDAQVLALLAAFNGSGQAEPPATGPAVGMRAASNDVTPAVTKPVTTVSTVRSTVRTESMQHPGPDPLLDTLVSRTASRTAFTHSHMFVMKGIAPDDAVALVELLVRRDEMLDDRRSCAECASYHAGRCRQRITPIGETTIYTLHRCRGFKLDECLDE